MVTTIDKNTALVIIDLQNAVLTMPVIHPIAALIENTNKLIAAFRKGDLPIVFVSVNPSKMKILRVEGGAPTRMELSESQLALATELHTHPNDIYITKHTWNAFFETKLNEELQSRNVTGIVLAGIATSIGVEGTARSAAELGYNISFAIDAMTDRFEDAHQHSLTKIFPRIGELDTTENIINKF
jgi:nicotinamidase-related amidase